MLDRMRRAIAVAGTRVIATWTWADLVVGGLVLAHVGTFLFIALSRASYPLDLEWMEGGQLLQAREILLGRLPYQAPSPDHIAYPYQPLYSAVVALVGAVTGLSLTTGRVVSIGATIALAALVGYGTYQETRRSWRAGVVAAGLVLSMYRATGYWFDLVRVDSLFLALTAAMLVASRHRRPSIPGLVLLAFSAFKTKQLALLFVWIPVVVLVTGRSDDRPRAARVRAAAIYGASLAVLLGADHVVESWATDGWYGFFTYKVPNVHPYVMESVRRYLWEEIFTSAPLLTLVGGWSVLDELRRRRLGASISPWTLAALAGVIATVMTWPRIGGAGNNLLTAYVFLVPPCVAALQRWTVRLRRTRFAAAPLLLLVVHFVQQVGDPRSQIPTKKDRAAAEELVAYLRSIDGPVLMPEHPWYPVLAGKAPSYHACELWELGKTEKKKEIEDAIAERLRKRAYRRVIVSDGWAPPGLEQAYARSSETPSPTGLRTFVGTPDTDPKQVFVPR